MMYTLPTIIFILFAISIATATISVHTIERGVYIVNHHFSIFTLSVSTATVSVDTIENDVCIKNNNFQFVCA